MKTTAPMVSHTIPPILASESERDLADEEQHEHEADRADRQDRRDRHPPGADFGQEARQLAIAAPAAIKLVIDQMEALAPQYAERARHTTDKENGA